MGEVRDAIDFVRTRNSSIVVAPTDQIMSMLVHGIRCTSMWESSQQFSGEAGGFQTLSVFDCAIVR
jgi:hypothetical protein